MKCGYAKLSIIPEKEVNLAGYDRPRPVTGVLDELTVRAISFDNGNMKLCLLSYDLIAIDHLLMDRVRERYRPSQNEELIFSATHTHSGPMGTIDTKDRKSTVYRKDNVFGVTDDSYLDFLAGRTIQAIHNAYDSAVDTGLFSLEYQVVGIGSNRNDKSMEGDPEVTALMLKKEDNEDIIFNYACHPTVLDSSNRLYSSDLAGAICRKAEGEFNGAIYLNGACGDISTRFNRQNSGPEELERLSDIFISEFHENRGAARKLDSDILSVRKIRIPLKIKEPMDTGIAERIYLEELNNLQDSSHKDQAALRLAQARIEGAKANLEYSQNYQGLGEHTLNCNLLNIGGIRFLTFPGEIFSELSNLIREEHDISIIGYCDGYSMYLTDSNAYEKSYYEAMSSPFAKGEGEKFVKMIIDELDKENENF